MALDKTTEAIAHFAGWFHLSAEQSRMRLEYDLFRHKQAEQKELEAREAKDLVVHHSFKLENYNPGLSYDPSSDHLSGNARPMGGNVNITAPALIATGPAEALLFMLNYANVQSGVSINFVLDPPSSMIALTIQYAKLSDNDSFGKALPDQFVAPDYFNAILTTLAGWASVLSPISIEMIPTAESAQDIASELMAQIADTLEDYGTSGQTPGQQDDSGDDTDDGAATSTMATQSTTEGEGPYLSVSVIGSEDANGLFINGEAAEELPEWEDLQPAYFRVEDTEETAADDDDAEGGGIATYSSSVTTEDPAAHDFTKDFETDILIPGESMPGHEIVAGANVMINFAGISSNWLDAGTIVVGGDWIELDVISQVNVLVDHDAAPGIGNAGLAESTASTVLNVARIEELSTEEAAARAESEAQEAEAEDGDPFDAQTADDAPAASGADDTIAATSVTTGAAAQASDGVTVHNQDTTTTPPASAADKSAEDTKQEVEHSGGPVAAAIVSISGSLVQINTAQQYSFASDNDTATIKFGESKLFLGLGENETLNSLTAFEAGFSYDLIIVSGNVISIDLITQMNVLFDSDLVDIPGAIGGTNGHSTESAVPGSEHSSCADTSTDTAQNETVSEQAGQTIHQSSTETTESSTQSTSETVTSTTSNSVTEASEVSVSSAESTSTETSVTNTTTQSTQQGSATTSSTSSGEAANENHQNSTHAAAVHVEGTDGNHGATAHANPHSIASGEAVEGGASVAEPETAPASEEGPGETDLNTNPLASGHGPQHAEAEPPCSQPDDTAPAAVSMGDNLLYNEALLTKVGKDTEAEMTGGFQRALDDLENDPDAMPQYLKNEAVFDKVEFLKILYIDGDFIKINKLDQINILGDADQISLLGESFANEMEGKFVLTTGSNSLANFASINETGVDSNVMVKGNSYSEALIHQAGFVDEQAVPDGVGIQALANEAVAFLADGMIDQNPASDIITSMDAQDLDSGPPADILQSVLS